ncbi:hypothetical protein MKX01_032228 [Papaver californicum]|nr:hypothetical protein MKX01_032228 [Papaver californicum]
MGELDQQETAPATATASHSIKRKRRTSYLRDDGIVLARESIWLCYDGISLMILSEQEMLEVTVENFEINRFNGMSEYLRLFCDQVKKEIVEKMAANILAFFIQPEESKNKKERCSAARVKFLLHKLVRISFTYTIGKNPSRPEATDLLFNLHQDFLQGNYDAVEELRKTVCWTGKDHMEKLRKDKELKLIRALSRANGRRKISEIRRLNVRAYFV